jgi:hypothetical protein
MESEDCDVVCGGIKPSHATVSTIRDARAFPDQSRYRPSELSLWRVKTVMWCAVDSSRAALLSDLAMPDTTAIHRPAVSFECAGIRIHAAILLVFTSTHM